MIVSKRRRYLGVVVLAGLLTIASGDAGAARPSHVVNGPAALGVQRAGLTVLSGAKTVDVTRTSGTSSLYRVATAERSGAVPSARESHGSVDVHVMTAGSGHDANLSVQLAPRVEWSIRLAGGATDERLDLSHLEVASVSVPAGVSDLTMQLPAPNRTSTISVAGGASEFDMSAPVGVIVRIDFIGGAGNASLDGVQHSGLAGNTILTSLGSVTAGGIDVTCPGGIGNFTLSRYTS